MNLHLPLLPGGGDNPSENHQLAFFSQSFLLANFGIERVRFALFHQLQTGALLPEQAGGFSLRTESIKKVSKITQLLLGIVFQ